MFTELSLKFSVIFLNKQTQTNSNTPYIYYVILYHIDKSKKPIQINWFVYVSLQQNANNNIPNITICKYIKYTNILVH